MTNPTSNYGFVLPTPTDLVTDLPADFEVALQGVDTQMKTNADAATQKATLTTKGDIYAATGTSTPARVAVGTNGQVLVADSTASTGVKWATPVSGSITWTNRVNINGSGAFRQIAYNGTNLYVAVASQGVLYTSPDGITWTSRTSGFGSNEIRDVAFGNGVWVAVGGNGTITSSSDGVTWTARTANMGTNQLNAVAYANSIWVAVGAGGGTTNTGGLTYSTDGTTWTRKSQSIGIGSSYWGLVWNGTNWIITAGASTFNFIYATTPSGTWTGGLTTNGGEIQWISWDGTRHVWSESQNFYFSTSTILATSTQYSGGLPVYTALINNTKQYSEQTHMFVSGYIQSFNNSSTARGSYLTTPILTPASRISLTFGDNNGSCMSIFPVGYIIGTNVGQIYTSF